MKKTNITKTIIVIAILSLMQIAAFAQKAELVVQTGHTSFMSAISYSPDGKLLATGGGDNVIKLWTADSIKELKTFKAHKDIVRSLDFSSDGKFLASCADDGVIYVWNVEHGTVANTISQNENETMLDFSSVIFSPDGTSLASVDDSGFIKLWNVRDGKLVKQIKYEEDKLPNNVYFWQKSNIDFSPDGKFIVFGGWESLSLWNVETGKTSKIISGHSDFVVHVRFSPDGKLIASGSLDKEIKIWDLETKREISSLKGHTSPIDNFAFNPDGKTIASIANEFTGDSDSSVRIWDVFTGTQIYFLDIEKTPDGISFNPDGTVLAIGYIEGDIRLVKADSGHQIAEFKSNNDLPFTKISNSGKLFAFQNNNILGVFNLENSKLNIVSDKAFNSGAAQGNLPIHNLWFNLQDNAITSGGYENLGVWDLTGNELKVIKHSPNDYFGAFWMNGNSLYAYFDHKSQAIKLVDSEKNRTITEIKEGKACLTFGMTFSSDGDFFAASCFGMNITSVTEDENGKSYDFDGEEFVTIFNLKNQKIISRITLDKVSGNRFVSKNSPYGNNFIDTHTPSIIPVEFSSNKDLLKVGGRILDVKSGSKLCHLGTDTLSLSSSGKWLAVEDNNRIAIIRKDVCENSDANETLHIEDLQENNDSVFFLNGHSARISHLQFTPDERKLISYSEDGKWIFWDIEKKAILATLVLFNQQDWAIVDPDGRFDASPGAEKFMHFVVGLEPVDLEQIKDRYYTPNLLQRIFKGENLDQARKVSVFTADELYPSAEYAPLKDGETVVKVKLKNRGGGIGRVQVFVNGAEFLADARPKGFDPKSSAGEFAIDFASAKTLKRGEANEIKIIARNEAGWLRSRGSDIVYLDDGKKDETPQEFYAIIGGVSEYENADYDLKYSAKDARDFAKALELGAVKLFGADKVHIRLLASGEEKAGLTGADSKQLLPSKENFRLAFEEFRKAKPTDVFVVYLAGHGTSINRGGDTGDTYLFLTKEAVTTDKSRLLDDKLRNDTTISSEELAEWIKEVPALKRAMILDTCAAGAVETSLVKPRDLSPDQIKALDRMKDRTGFYVLMGSAADAQSYEATRYGQGLLTYSLLQGMSGAKLRDGEYADVSSLFSYATDEVVEMAKGIGGIQQPRIIAPTESRTFDIGQFSSVEKGKFTLAKIKPVILQPQLYNDKLKRDNLKISQMVAKALRDESSTISRGGVGAEAKLVFVEAEEMNDAVTPSGVYEINGDQVKVTLILVVNNEEIRTVTVEGSLQNTEELSAKIVAAIIENAPN